MVMLGLIQWGKFSQACKPPQVSQRPSVDMKWSPVQPHSRHTHTHTSPVPNSSITGIAGTGCNLPQVTAWLHKLEFCSGAPTASPPFPACAVSSHQQTLPDTKLAAQSGIAITHRHLRHSLAVLHE
eukprot:171089-Pelagomonas_calceolata.AAC.7